MSETIFVPHSEKQQKAIRSEKKYTIVGTGIQWGKTRVGSVRVKRDMHRFTASDDNFIITAPTYKIMQQSTLPAFLHMMRGLGEYSKADAVFKMHDGGTCFVRTETDPDSIVGITNVRHIWCDEAGLYRLYFWQNVEARAAFYNCPVTITTSPYSRNWLFKDFIKPVMLGKRDDVCLVQARSDENPYFPKDSFENAKKTMNPTRFAMMFGGEWGAMEGLVYDCFDADLNTIEPFGLPAGTRYFGGIDWGFSDPFVLVIHAITPDGMRYSVSEFYKTQLTVDDMIQVALQKKKVYGIQSFFADPSRPEHIEAFNRAGLSCIAAKNDIRIGVDVMYSQIKTRKFKFFRGLNPISMDEMETYHYEEEKDLKPEQESKDVSPVGQNDHCMDAHRYVTIMTERNEKKLTPKTSEEVKKAQNHEERLAALKRGRRAFRGTENWS